MDFGVFSLDNQFEVIRSIDRELTSIFGKYLYIEKFIFTPSDIALEESVLFGACAGQEGQVAVRKYDSFSLDESASVLKGKHTSSTAILDFLGRVIKKSLFEQKYN